MVTGKVAKRYAKGLLDVTQKAGNTDAIFTEMLDIVKTVEGSKELKNFFASPIIDSKKKSAAAAEIFKNFSPLSQNLIALVIKQGRENHLQSIAQEFINKVEDLRGVQRVTLTSATELSRKNMEDILRNSNLVKGQGEYDIKTIINPEILGGYILRVGDQQIDASVKTKLNRLKKEFQHN